MAMGRCPRCNSEKIVSSCYRGWFKCDNCLEVFD